jgi:hypothetical protein
MADKTDDREPRRVCPPYCECEDCQAASAHWCECCGEGDATYRGDLEGYYCDGCPHSAQCKLPEPHEPADPLATLELRIGELRGIVAGMGEAYLATLPEHERRLITETRAHLAEYDRAKRGEGGHG